MKIKISVNEFCDYMDIPKDIEDLICYGSLLDYAYDSYNKEDMLYWFPKKFDYLKDEIENGKTSEIFPSENNDESLLEILKQAFIDSVVDCEYSGYEKSYDNNIENAVNSITDKINTIAQNTKRGYAVKSSQYDRVNQQIIIDCYKKEIGNVICQIIDGEGYFSSEEYENNPKDYLHYLLNDKLISEIYGLYSFKFQISENCSNYKESYFENRIHDYL